MFKIFVRFYLLMIFLITLIVIYSDDLTVKIEFAREKIGLALAKGSVSSMFAYIDKQLLSEPEQNWQAILNSLTPTSPHYPLQIIPLAAIKFNDARQTKELFSGNMVVDVHFYKLDTDVALSSNNQSGPIIYQRIGNSNKALSYPMSMNEDVNILAQQGWLLSFIIAELQKNSNEASQQVLQAFSQHYDTPVKIIPISNLNDELQVFLRHNQYFYGSMAPFNTTPLNFYYLLNANEALEIGPYPYPWYIKNYAIITLFIFMCLIAGIMFISIYPLYKDFRKLELTAENYGEGKFTYDVNIKRYAALYQFYQNLKKMGRQIKNLITSHKELTEALSHEMKTPLARLKFAVTMAEDEDNKANAKIYFAEAQQAMNTIDDLISELLLYFSFDRHDLDLKLKSINIADWLRTSVDEKKDAPLGKTLTLEISETVKNCKVSLAPVYLKKALENLLSNAFRYAKSVVAIKLDADDHHCYLHIADDGVGVPQPQRDKIFEPFFSSDESRWLEFSGHGLGLAIVMRIVTVHHGQIRVGESQWGGAEFIIVFPRSFS